MYGKQPLELQESQKEDALHVLPACRNSVDREIPPWIYLKDDSAARGGCDESVGLQGSTTGWGGGVVTKWPVKGQTRQQEEERFCCSRLPSPSFHACNKVFFFFF